MGMAPLKLVGAASLLRNCVHDVSEPSKPERKRGLPDLGTLALSDPMRTVAV